MANLKKKTSIPEYEQDWHNKPGLPTLDRLRKIIGLTEMRQNTILQQLETTEDKQVEPVAMSSIYGYDNLDKTWKKLGNKCFDCGKVLREGRITEKHPLICKRTLKINKSEEEEILKLVRKNNANS